MITLIGMLDLNKEQAPAVTLRIGDTMRQTELTVDNSIDLSNCTAELYMVKPDSTFVIATCTITEDNTIIVSWPEQAAAVKGLGEYCIRITSSDPAYVYSARGPVWIDDHVITEDMIESVAEVNGNIFPDDFALKSEIPVVDEVINDDIIAEDKTWSSAKLDDILTDINNSISSMLNYSTEEKIVGKWIDNKFIYEKTIILSSPVTLSYNTWVTINEIPSSNYDTVIELKILTPRGIMAVLADTKDNPISLFSPYNSGSAIVNGVIIRYTKIS